LKILSYGNNIDNRITSCPQKGRDGVAESGAARDAGYGWAGIETVWRITDMKIFHLSDLHIGLKLINNRDIREDQVHILDQIIEKAGKEQPDAVVIAGDIYDKAVPSAEAVEVFGRFTSNISYFIEPKYPADVII